MLIYNFQGKYIYIAKTVQFLFSGVALQSPTCFLLDSKLGNLSSNPFANVAAPAATNPTPTGVFSDALVTHAGMATLQLHGKGPFTIVNVSLFVQSILRGLGFKNCMLIKINVGYMRHMTTIVS